MKKPARKLVLSRETLRTLDTVDLVHVAGGAVADSNDTKCESQVVAAVGVSLVEAK